MPPHSNSKRSVHKSSSVCSLHNDSTLPRLGEHPFVSGHIVHQPYVARKMQVLSQLLGKSRDARLIKSEFARMYFCEADTLVRGRVTGRDTMCRSTKAKPESTHARIDDITSELPTARAMMHRETTKPQEQSLIAKHGHFYSNVDPHKSI